MLKTATSKTSIVAVQSVVEAPGTTTVPQLENGIGSLVPNAEV